MLSITIHQIKTKKQSPIAETLQPLHLKTKHTFEFVFQNLKFTLQWPCKKTDKSTDK